ncbi:MAG: hypothetical protein AAF226_14610, partial [Verrucomicrobiota bacterium]
VCLATYRISLNMIPRIQPLALTVAILLLIRSAFWFRITDYDFPTEISWSLLYEIPLLLAGIALIAAGFMVVCKFNIHTLKWALGLLTTSFVPTLAAGLTDTHPTLWNFLFPAESKQWFLQTANRDLHSTVAVAVSLISYLILLRIVRPHLPDPAHAIPAIGRVGRILLGICTWLVSASFVRARFPSLWSDPDSYQLLLFGVVTPIALGIGLTQFLRYLQSPHRGKQDSGNSELSV